LAADDGRRMAVKVVDVSMSGMGIVGDDRLQTRQAVTLAARIPDLPDMVTQSLVQFRATVVYQALQRGAWRAGLLLDTLTPEQEALLKDWLARRSTPW
jgi:hypothetical protein